MEDGYLNFDEYIRQGDPSQREKAGYWQTAIGLQAVDGLKVSSYLMNLARKNIEGEITIEEVNKLLDLYYKEKHKAKYSEYETYTRVDDVDPIESKMGRPI